METIRNYLESMFRGLPQTEKVMKAKSELLQMMEDKYTELIRSGKTENEAVGEVIQNFGNLDELADDLGIKEIMHQSKYSDVQRRKVYFEEITEYLAAKQKAILIKSIGIFLFIICVTFPIIINSLDLNNLLGAVLLFIAIGIGVVCMAFSVSFIDQWKYLKNEPCTIDAVSIDYLKNRLRDFTPTYSVLSSVGVLMCILCFIPTAIFIGNSSDIIRRMAPSFLFFFVGVGVFMMVYAKSMKMAYLKLLRLNNIVDFEEVKFDADKIDNPTVRVLMSSYWSIITCVYLCLSFLTFKWGITWLIWPIAAAVHSILKGLYGGKDGDSDKSTK